MTRSKNLLSIQARIAQLVAYWLGTGEVPGLNNFSMKMSIIVQTISFSHRPDH